HTHTHAHAHVHVHTHTHTHTHTLTSDLLFQAEDDSYCLGEYEEFGLRLLSLQVQLHHAPELLEGLVDVTHTQALSRVIGHPPLALALRLLLRVQVVVVSRPKHSTT